MCLLAHLYFEDINLPLNQTYNKIEMKVLCIALLMILASQLRLQSHEQENPLAGKMFRVQKAVREVPNTIGTAVDFSPAGDEFIISHTAVYNYTIGENNSFSISD